MASTHPRPGKRTYVGVTDGKWAEFLQSHPTPDDVNFWKPSAAVGFAALSPGEPFLFKSKYPEPEIIGGGFYEGFVQLRVSEAWDFFGPGNGVPDAATLTERIAHYKGDLLQPGYDPTIGCIMLSGVTWFRDRSLPSPQSWAKNIVSGRTYALGEEPIIDLAVQQLGTHLEALSRNFVETRISSVPGEAFGAPRLVAPRLGQGAFRALVLDAYNAHCAITGHKIRPTLQAAHIRPVTQGGEHRLDNGLLLRSDIHTLFDRGYLTVDSGYRLHVSPRLRSEFGNGDELYDRAARGQLITLPERSHDRPSAEFLEWHGDEIFLAS